MEPPPDAIIGFDLNGMITSWDSTAEKLFGHATAHIVGRPVTTRVSPDRRKEFTRRCEHVLHGAGTEAWETERIHNTGIRTLVSATVAVFRESSGAAVGLVAVFRDLGDRRRYERHSRIAEILQESLIPSELPEIPGLRFACRYRPAAEFGGDWMMTSPSWCSGSPANEEPGAGRSAHLGRRPDRVRTRAGCGALYGYALVWALVVAVLFSPPRRWTASTM